MLARRSLGDSPLEHESNDIALLDFIGRSDHAVQPRSMHVRDVDNAHDGAKVDKKIVSYYIEKDIVKRVKSLATLTERSYSSLVAEALKKLLRDYGF